MLRFVMGAIFAVAGAGLEITVNVHYPEQNSPFDLCGLGLKVATTFDLDDPPTATRVGPDLFRTVLNISDVHLYTQISLAVMAHKWARDHNGTQCRSVCPHISPQGMLVSQGPWVKTDMLTLSNEVSIWPSFCQHAGSWTTKNVTFHSRAVNNTVRVVARLPAHLQENPLRRPGNMLPAIMFRFNSEWYWNHPAEEYTVWHELMVQGVMEPFAVAEMYFDDVNWNSWDNQPIFTQQQAVPQCTCESELQFICHDWEKNGFPVYNGTLHHFGAATAFTDELHDLVMPQVLTALPDITAGTREELRLGVWGYCIGGLAAWNALTSPRRLFSIGYLGSPAMDWDCGAPFANVAKLDWTASGPRPKIYIDAGAGEGTVMERQTLMLMRWLQERGAVEGSDVFYTRAEFGTHDTLNLLRRALRGLLVLFGTGEETRGFYTPTASSQALAEPMKAPEMLAEQASEQGGAYGATSTALIGLASVAVAFAAGRRSAQQGRAGVAVQEPLLA